MAATPHPAPPNAVPWDEGAVQKGIKREGTAEVKIKNEAVKKEQKKPEDEPASDTKPEDSSDQDANRPRSTSNADSVVEVSLDSPAQEKSEPDFSETPDTTVNGKDADALKTPTRAMSPMQPLSPVDKPDRKGKGRAVSAAATWSSIIASVVDHTDEHTTK